MSFFRRILAVAAALCVMLPVFATAERPLEEGTPMTLTSPAAILAETSTGTGLRRQIKKI